MNLPVLKTNKNPLYSGQTLLLVLLSMAVVLTIVLSILSRSVTDVAITSREEESQRAFSAAEAGIEASLSGFAGGVGLVGENNSASYLVNPSAYGEGSTSFIYPISLISGETGIVWFVSHDGEGNMTCTDGNCFTGTSMEICWGSEANDLSTTPAIEVSVFYATALGDYRTIQIGRATGDPFDGRRETNKFGDASGECEIDGQTFAFSKTINFADMLIPAVSYGNPNGLQFALIRLLYNTTITQKFGVIVTGGTLPSQGFSATSTGTAGEATRKVEVFQGYSEVAPIFQSAIYNLGGLTKGSNP